MLDFELYLPDTIDHITLSVRSFMPELALSLAFLGTILATLFGDRHWKDLSWLVFVLGILCSFTALTLQHGTDNTAFFGMLKVDSFSVYSRGIILFGVLSVALLLRAYHRRLQTVRKPGDMYSILLATTVGLHLLTITTNWLLIFIGIEMISIGSYILVSYFSSTKPQAEAAMKYVLFGSTCAACMLYGLSILYGFTGSLDFSSTAHMQGLMISPKVWTILALLFVFVGIGFKLGFVPFHVWTPDVYEGAPTPVTAFLSTVPKVSAITLLSRLISSWSANPFYFGELSVDFLFFIAIITMLVGNLIALRQENIKRLMAYSSIGHTGFLLMACIAYMSGQQEVLLFYLVVYTVMNLAAFACIMSLEDLTKSTDLRHYSGLGKKFPLVFSCFSLLGISLVGLPPTGGFVAKLLVFSMVFSRYELTGEFVYICLLIAGILTSVISLFYYLKIPLYSFLRDTNKTASLPGCGISECSEPSNSDQAYPSRTAKAMLVIFTLIVLISGLFPSLIMSLLQ